MSRNPLKLDEEELQILRDFERGEFESIQHFRKEKRSLEAAARRTLQKDKRINIRISSRDLEKLQKRAVWKGSPIRH
jgi:predicted DNA binding CopG/RHH family protein